MLLIGFFLLSLNFNFAVASDDDDDGIDDDFEDLNKRDIDIEIEANQIQIESSLRSGDRIDQIQLKIITDSEGLTIEVSYESEIASTELELQFGIGEVEMDISREALQYNEHTITTIKNKRS